MLCLRRSINSTKKMKNKKLTFEQFWKEFEKLKRRAEKVNVVSGNVMIIVSTRIKRKR